MSRFLKNALLLSVVFAGLCLLTSPAHACPACANSIASDETLPRAYMYSILFMLAMPATVFSTFGFLIYRAFKKHAAQQAALTETIGALADESSLQLSRELVGQV